MHTSETMVQPVLEFSPPQEPEHDANQLIESKLASGEDKAINGPQKPREASRDLSREEIDAAKHTPILADESPTQRSEEDPRNLDSLPSCSEPISARSWIQKPVETSMPPPARQLTFTLKAAGGTIVLILVWTFLRSALRIVEIPTRDSCPEHGDTAISRGLVPRRYQEGFSKAAWHLPKNWHTWLHDDIFQSHSGHQSFIVPINEAKATRGHIVKIGEQIPKVLEQATLPALTRAAVDMKDEVEPIIHCLSNEALDEWASAGARGLPNKIASDRYMSISCKMNVRFKWSGLKMLAAVLANTENIIRQGTQALNQITAARNELFQARQTLRDTRRDLEVKLKMKVSIAARDEIVRLLPGKPLYTDDMATGGDIILQKFRKAASEIQQVYLAVLWLDLEFASLDAALKSRQQHITEILEEVISFEQEETVASVKNILSQNQLQAAWRGQVDLLPHRTWVMLVRMQQVMKAMSETRGFQAGACSWAKEHMPLHISNCTCGQVERRRAWRIWRDSKEDRIEQAKKQLEHYFWHELEQGKIWWDNSTEAGPRQDEAEAKFRTPDIRTLKFCREQGGSERPFNPR